MIFVTFGTFHCEFQRPLRIIEKAVIDGKVNEEIIVQSGHTTFTSPYLKITPFFTPEELSRFYDEARVIVSHAGIGSVLMGVRKGKKLIVTARLKKFNEHVDDHQLDILEAYAGLHHILPWYENESFENMLEKIKDFTPAPYVSNKEKLIDFLIDYIDKI